MIKDSGDRREFESGAVRDIVSGKGRCDLLPLSIMNLVYKKYHKSLVIDQAELVSAFQLHIHMYMENSDEQYLINLSAIIAKNFWCNWSTAMLELSMHFEEGAIKYGEYNWQKGIPVRSYLDSALRHFYKWERGDIDESHSRACLWNLVCAIWTSYNLPQLKLSQQYEERVVEE